MEGKKISFGFKKTKKADKLIPDNNDDKKDYIECVEEQSIKIVGGDTLASNEPLVIPMKPNSLMKPDRLREIALKVEGALEEPSIKIEPMEDGSATDPLAENETLEQMAVRELMQDSKKELKIENPVIAIPTSTKGIADGETESTLDDYDAVPVQEFGVAMLRGMGWTPGQASSNYKQPELRPKGLGLGADKVIKAKPDASKDSKQEELLILKNSYVKIVCGKYSDYYGKVVSLDEDNGRVMVEIPLKKETVSLSEFMMHAVTKSEYDKESKVINSESYEEYKRKELSQKSSRQEDKKTSYLRQDGKDRGRKEEKENDGRDEKERRHDKVKDRKDEKERDRRDEKDRRDDREREKGPEKELGKRPDRVQESRDEKQTESRDDKESERKDRQGKNNDSRRRRDQESGNGKSKNRQKRDSSSSEDRSSRKKKSKKRHDSSDSLSSLSDDDKKQYKHSKNKSRRRSRSKSDSCVRSTTPEAKRDIDKKRKGKKKKRDRDRSPNYKKHRK